MKNPQPINHTGHLSIKAKYVLCFLLLVNNASTRSEAKSNENTYIVSFSQHPSSQSPCENSGTSFTVVASGTGALSYQWQESTNGGGSYSNISSTGIYSGTGTPTLLISSVTLAMNSYRYRCVVTDNSGATNSNPAILTVNARAIVQTANVRHTICASGGGTLTAQFFAGQSYQWQVSSDVGSTWSNIADGGSYSGATTDVLFITNPAALNGSLYRYIASTLSGCPSTSSIDTLYVLQPVINTQPLQTSVCVNGTASFTMAASSPVNLTYQWQLGATALTNNSTYSGVTTPTLTISNVTAAMDRQLYRAGVRDTLMCLTNSNQVRLLVVAPPVINTQPQNVTTCAGLNVNLSVNASSATVSGIAALTYQWQTDNGTGGVTWSNITTGGTAAGLSLTSVPISMNGYRYRVRVSTGACGTVTSSEVTLTVRSSGTWLGAVDTNWHVAGNWCGGVPISTTDVLIPNWAPRMPTISNNTGVAFSRSLTIENTAKLTINGGTTTMIGPFNIQGTVLYSAMADQPVLPADHGSLEINGSGNKFLQVHTGISHNLRLGGTAKLVTTNSILTMKAGSNAITGASFAGATSSWIVTGKGNVGGAGNTGLGGLRYEQVNAGRGSILFPIGPTSISYNPALLANEGATDDLTIAVNDQMIPGGLVNSGIDRTWLISEAAAGGSQVTLELAWNQPEEGTMFRRGRSEVIRSNGESIIEHSPTDSAIGLNPYSRDAAAFTVLTQFSVASYTSAVTLPVKIESFAANKENSSTVRLSWKTGDDNDRCTHYVQRSTDGTHFTTIGSLKGEPGRASYSFTDIHFTYPTAWYRLQLVANGGKAVYSQIIRITEADGLNRLEIRPTVSAQHEAVSLFITHNRKEGAVIRMADVSGRVVMYKMHMLEAGQNSILLDTDHLQKGVYLVNVFVGQIPVRTLRLVKQ